MLKPNTGARLLINLAHRVENFENDCDFWSMLTTNAKPLMCGQVWDRWLENPQDHNWIFTEGYYDTGYSTATEALPFFRAWMQRCLAYLADYNAAVLRLNDISDKLNREAA